MGDLRFVIGECRTPATIEGLTALEHSTFAIGDWWFVIGSSEG